MSTIDLAAKNENLSNAPIGVKTREKLKDYFRETNERLYEFLGTDFRW
jgi:hypothetical protein